MRNPLLEATCYFGTVACSVYSAEVTAATPSLVLIDLGTHDKNKGHRRNG